MADWDRLELSESMKAWGDYFNHSDSGALNKLANLVLGWATRVAALKATLRTIAVQPCSGRTVPVDDCGQCPSCLARAALEAEERARTGDEAAG